MDTSTLAIVSVRVFLTISLQHALQHSYTEVVSPDALLDAHGLPISVTCSITVVLEGNEAVDNVE